MNLLNVSAKQEIDERNFIWLKNQYDTQKERRIRGNIDNGDMEHVWFGCMKNWKI